MAVATRLYYCARNMANVHAAFLPRESEIPVDCKEKARRSRESSAYVAQNVRRDCGNASDAGRGGRDRQGPQSEIRGHVQESHVALGLSDFDDDDEPPILWTACGHVFLRDDFQRLRELDGSRQSDGGFVGNEQCQRGDDDRLGRRILMLTGMVGMLISSICILICLHMVISKRDPSGAAMYFTIIFICLFVASFAIGPGPIPWFFVNEVFDTSTKRYAVSVTATTYWFATFIIAVSFSSWQKLTGPFAFFLFIACLIFFIGFTYFCLPETKGRSIKDVQRELQQKAPC